MNRKFWEGKRVFITGHTGFKGSWLSLWLQDMGAEVHGYALAPPTMPNLFTLAKVENTLSSHTIEDIRNYDKLLQVLREGQPEIIFHLAAQSLVGHSYADPTTTYDVNVMGTINLLEAVRNIEGVKGVLIVTSDKCYENREWQWGYRENDQLGGHDPYSSSKACIELICSSWRQSFLNIAGICLASARAGNVIGGGDFAQDRLLPDFFRALHGDHELVIRSPSSIRPWQYVLEPLAGYLILAQHLYAGDHKFAEAWNFGPEDSANCSVEWILNYLVKKLPYASWKCLKAQQVHEAHMLKLDSSKSQTLLGWRPQWNLDTALDTTVEWYDAWRNNKNLHKLTLDQIHRYEKRGIYCE